MSGSPHWDPVASWGHPMESPQCRGHPIGTRWHVGVTPLGPHSVPGSPHREPVALGSPHWDPVACQGHPIGSPQHRGHPIGTLWQVGVTPSRAHSAGVTPLLLGSQGWDGAGFSGQPSLLESLCKSSAQKPFILLLMYEGVFQPDLKENLPSH